MTKMTIGNRLKKARQDKQVTVNEVYQQTRIHPDVLNALEEDKFDKILNSIYVRSFLKEYASYLKLDAKKFLEEYDGLRSGNKANIPKAVNAENKPLSFGINTEKFAKVIRATVALSLAGILLIFFVKAAGRVIKKETATPGKVKKIAPVLPGDMKKKSQKSTEKVIPASPKETPIPAAEALKLSITAADDVWIELRVDGKVIFKNVLKKGASETWQAKDSFKIWTGNASAMQINLNGRNLGSPGKGVMKSIVITREGIKK